MIKKIYLEIIIATSIIVACLAGLMFEVGTYSGKSAIMPFAILCISSILSLVWLGQSLLELRKPLSTTNDIVADISESKKLFAFCSLTFIYVIGILFIGFFTATIIAIPIISISLGYKSLKGIAITTVLFTSILFIIFSLFLKVPLPVEIWNGLLEGA